MYLLTNHRAESRVHALAWGILEEAVCCLGLLGASSVATVRWRNYVLPEAWETGRTGSISSNLNMNQLGELTHSHFLASTSAPEHLSSCLLFFLCLSPTGSEMALAITWGLGGVGCVAILQSFPSLDLDQVVFLHRNLSSPLLYGHSESLPRS